MITTVISELEGPGFYLAQFKTNELTAFSYYIESQGRAALVDPTFDIQVYTEIINKRSATLNTVFLSHYHSDLVTGHSQFNTSVVMGPHSQREDNKFNIHQAADGQMVPLGNVKVQVIHTPGHTLESSCFLLYDSKGVATAMFTGDTLLLADFGSPDSAAKKESIATNQLGSHLYSSIQKIKNLSDDIRIYPSHGSRLVCVKVVGGGHFNTLGSIKQSNPAFTLSEAELTKKINQEMAQASPQNVFIANTNISGQLNYIKLLKNVYTPLKAEDFKALNEKAVVIDTRSDLKEGMIEGSYWLSSKGALAYWLTILLPHDADLLVVCEPTEFQAIADRLLRIGYFNIRGFNNFPLSEWPETLIKPTIIGFEQLKQIEHPQHLDVRNEDELMLSGKTQNSISIPLPQIASRVEELRGKANLVVNCRTGQRARVAYSVLLKHGISSVVLAENFQNFEKNGLKVIPFK